MAQAAKRLTRRQWLRAAFGASATCALGVRELLAARGSSLADGTGRAAMDILFGAALEPVPLRDDPAYGPAFARYCRIATLAGPLYWSRVEPIEGQFAFGDTASLLAFTEAHRIPARGHTLVWHEGLPEWVPLAVTRMTGEDILVKHISRVVAEFRGRIHSWDVLNEAVDPAMPQSLRKTLWLDSIGDRYLSLAFRTARTADPNALLGYNEFGLESDSRSAARKRMSVLDVVRTLRQRDVPIDYLGIQGHLYAHDTYSDSGLGGFIREIRRLGLRVFITEMDVDDASLPADERVRDRMVAATYARFLDVALGSGAVEVVITWGLTDRSTWLNRFDARKDGLPQRSLPFDTALRPKPAWKIIARHLGIRDTL